MKRPATGQPPAPDKIGAVYTPRLLAEQLAEQTFALWSRQRGALSLEALDALTVFDPACGEGALLKAAHGCVVAARQGLGQDLALAHAETLRRNISGVDVDVRAVEAARQGLGGARIKEAEALLGDGAWPAQGCDMVIANPPYVTIQRVKTRDPDFARALVEARGEDGEPRFESVAAGSFDLYLLFVERALEALRPGGVLGLLAPSSWLVNVHGRALRRIVHRGGHLARWVDFGSRQLFEGAVTYSALQLFTAEPSPELVFSLDAVVPRDWSSAERIKIGGLDPKDAWHLMPGEIRAVIASLKERCEPLSQVCDGIGVGVQTSADRVFHLQTAGETGRYLTRDGQEVTIEPSLMRPLVSGREVGAFARPQTATHLLFPYKLEDGVPSLISPEVMCRDHPLAWAYLKRRESLLRARERGRFDTQRWYRFGRHQNMGRQHLPKLLVPRLVRRLRAAPDLDGEFTMDNVDVGGVLASSREELFFLLAVINSSVADFVWSQTSRPFQNGYRSANKQFIAPIPVPAPPPRLRGAIVAACEALCRAHSSGCGVESLDESRRVLDGLVTRAYGLSSAERAVVMGSGG